MSPMPPGGGNPYGDENINPSTGEKFPHLTEEATEPTPEPVPEVSSPTPPPATPFS